MPIKITSRRFALIALGTFIVSGLYLISVFLQVAAESYTFHNGAIIGSLNFSVPIQTSTRSVNKINQTTSWLGTKSFCHGLWDCAEKICELGNFIDSFVYVHPIAINETCSVYTVNSANWLWHRSSAKASLIIFGIACIFEIIGLTIYIIIKDDFCSRQSKIISINLLLIGPLLMLISHTCMYVTIFHYNHNDKIPLFVTISQIITSIGLLTSSLFVHASLIPIPKHIQFYYD